MIPLLMHETSSDVAGNLRTGLAMVACVCAIPGMRLECRRNDKMFVRAYGI